MPDFDDPDFDPNAYLAQDPSEWDDDAHDLAIQGGLEDLVDKHVQATGQLPDQTQADAYLAQATQDQLPFMRDPDAGAPISTPLSMPDGNAATPAQNGSTADDGPQLTFPMQPEPAHDHLEWSMPPAPDTPSPAPSPASSQPTPAQDPSNADTAPQANDTPPVPQPRPPQSPTDTQQADGAPPTPTPTSSPSAGQPGLKGPFISQKSGTELLNEANGNWLYTPHDLQNGNSKECTALTKYATGAPPTSQWAEGEKVTPQMLGHLKPGTAIATFTNDKYVNASGNHAAVVKEVNASLQNPSVTVVEQWKNHPPVETTYYFNRPGDSRIHDMANYSVVMAR